jgi:hypothetical protein
MKTFQNIKKCFVAALVKIITMFIWNQVNGRLSWVRSGFFE